MRLELAQTFAVGSDATTWRFPPGCVRQRRIEWEVSSHLCASRQDTAHPTVILYLIMLDYLLKAR